MARPAPWRFARPRRVRPARGLRIGRKRVARLIREAGSDVVPDEDFARLVMTPDDSHEVARARKNPAPSRQEAGFHRGSAYGI
jgi:hypothetical protein